MKYFKDKFKQKARHSQLAFKKPEKELTYKDIFGKEFTQEDFEEIKAFNADKNRQCFMCLKAYKKKFEGLTVADKYHIAVHNP